MGRISTVLFDLDGTLIHSAPDLLTAANRILEQESRELLTIDDIKMFVGDGVPKLVERAFEKTGEPAGDRLDELVARFLEWYDLHAADESRPFPGVEEALKGLKAAGVPMGVCTNKPYTPSMEILETCGIASYFSVVIGGDTVPGVKKPDPRHLQTAIDRLDADTSSTLMIGDNKNDVDSARATGIPVITYRGGYPRMDPEALGSDLVFDDFRDVPRIIAEWT